MGWFGFGTKSDVAPVRAKSQLSTPPERSRIAQLFNARSIMAGLVAVCLILISHYVIQPSDAARPFSQRELLKTLLHEVGFATLVALVIWGTFEYFSNVQNEEQWNHRIERIAKSVFFGVFGRNFPPELIQEANVLLLEKNFVRLGFHITYTLNDDVYRDGHGDERNYVRLEAVARFRIRNISNSGAACPIGLSLPNPMHDALKEKSGVNRVVVRRRGSDEPVKLAIEEAERAFRTALADNTQYQARYGFEPISLAAGEEVEVVWDYVMAKEEEDTEIGQTLHPADSLIITVMDTNPSRRTVRARAIHPSPLEDDTSAAAKGTYIFRLERWVLPHQGFAIWWKRDVVSQPPPAAGPGTSAAEGS